MGFVLFVPLSFVLLDIVLCVLLLLTDSDYSFGTPLNFQYKKDEETTIHHIVQNQIEK